MRFIETSEKTVEQVMKDLQDRVKANAFGVLNIHDLKATLKNKGFDLTNECYVLDVCNPRQAIHVLTQDIGMNVALPCRVSVYDEGGKTRIAMIKPTAMLNALSDSAELAEVAKEVEAILIKIIREAK
ncbi:MAG: DUF302 domain-containing protein [Proteobacteria bacterium]|nr:DUF302 domain-containing protein [Pseudomonadota bacterium]